MIPQEIIKLLPGLRLDLTAKEIGPASNRYNCIMHVIGGRLPNIWPTESKPIDVDVMGVKTFWPTDLSNDDSLETFISLFKKFKYDICDDESYDSKYRKIAIFCKKGTNIVTHASLQKDEAIWTSKLGQSILIQHLLYSIEGDAYGTVRCFMRRPVTITKEFDQSVIWKYLEQLKSKS